MNISSPLYQTEMYNESQVTPIRQSVFEGNIKKYQTNFNSKWANLKSLLQIKTSLESSVNTLRNETLEQFSSKIHKIYKKKIIIREITQNNSKIFFNANKDFTVKKINILDGVNNISYYEDISNILFELRYNNNLMLNFIDSLTENEHKIMIPFLCHFFYENFYMESTEQEEMLYIIYLLLEKEIDKLNTPSINSFLDDSFISKFLYELSNRYEIKCYINVVLNSLIRKINDINSNYLSLDIFNDAKKKSRNQEIKNDNKVAQSVLFHDRSTQNSFNQRGLNLNDDFRKTENMNSQIKHYMGTPLGNNDFFLNQINYSLNEYEMRKLFQDKTDITQRELLLKHLRYSKTSKNSNLFSNSNFCENLNKKMNVLPKEIINQYYSGYTMIIEFIEDLFHNLENETIIPYSIKIVCKIIFVLIKQKFKYISNLERDIFVGAFFFEKLILPVLLNPDINETGYNSIISMSTRKNLYNIYLVLKKFTRAELFTSDTSPHFTIFNQYILDNIQKIDEFVKKVTKLELPFKLKKLSELFYENDLYVLNSEEKDPDLITYDYFAENKKDFMQHQSICFNIEQLLLIINKIHDNELFKYTFNNKSFKESSEKLFEFQDFFQSQKVKEEQDYYVIMNDKYPPEVSELLKKKAEIKPLFLNKTTNCLNEIKYAICYLLTHFEILPHWEWVTGNYKTENCFETIDKYLNNYYNNIILPFNSNVPLCWYSTYIINNLKNIPQEYQNNDFQKLHDEIVEEFKSTMKKLNRLNDFLTIQITTKFFLIDHKIKITDEELKNIKSTEKNIKTELFIEKRNIPVLLASKYEILEEKQKKEKNINLNQGGFKQLNEIICVIDTREKYEKNSKIDFKNDKDFLLHLEDNIKNKYKCLTINDFAERFSNYHIINADIVNIDLNRDGYTKAREVLEIYISYVKEELTTYFYPNYNNLQNDLNKCESSHEIEELNKKINELKEEIESQSKIIWNYILKRLCNKYYSEVPIQIDIDFNRKCKELAWIEPIKHLLIQENVFEKNIFQIIVNHMKNMDNYRTPAEKLNEFGKGVQLINSLYLFSINKKDPDAADFLPLVIYAIILCQPKRLIWTIRFIKLFLNSNELLGNNGYNLTQAESATKYILNLDYKQVHIPENEFEDNCKKFRYFENENK